MRSIARSRLRRGRFWWRRCGREICWVRRGLFYFRGLVVGTGIDHHVVILMRPNIRRRMGHHQRSHLSSLDLLAGFTKSAPDPAMMTCCVKG